MSDNVGFLRNANLRKLLRNERTKPKVSDMPLCRFIQDNREFVVFPSGSSETCFDILTEKKPCLHTDGKQHVS